MKTTNQVWEDTACDTANPKRRKDKYNLYSIVRKDGRFYVSFRDGEGRPHSIEVNEAIYEHFNCAELEDLSYLNIWDRYLEQSELTEATLNMRIADKGISMEDFLINREQIDFLHKIISELPETQRCRLILYFFDELTYEQIAEKEGCTKMPVKRAIDRALAEIREKLLAEGYF